MYIVISRAYAALQISNIEPNTDYNSVAIKDRIILSASRHAKLNYRDNASF